MPVREIVRCGHVHGLVEAIDVHLGLTHLADQLGRVTRVVVRQVVVAEDIGVRLLDDGGGEGGDEPVLLELSVLALLAGLFPLSGPLGHDHVLLIRDDVHGFVHGEVVVVHLLAVVL